MCVGPCDFASAYLHSSSDTYGSTAATEPQLNTPPAGKNTLKEKGISHEAGDNRRSRSSRKDQLGSRRYFGAAVLWPQDRCDSNPVP